MTDLLPELLDVREAAAALRLSVPTLYRWSSEGKLPHYKISNRLLFARSDLAALLEAARQDPEAARSR